MVLGLLGNLVHKDIQEKWLKAWSDGKLYAFHEDSKKPFYVIDSPPPFPTGEFHMGNVLNWCYFDYVARFKRMNGFEVLFPQGWDCHGFPTEVKVEKKHGRLPREEFIAKCLEWTQNVISTVKPQMISLGYSIDWAREYYTPSPEYKRAVQYSLVKMFEKKLVYRAQHPVLWCTRCKSAIAKAETQEIQRATNLHYIAFKEEKKEKEKVLIATTRPELLHACVAALVHPGDARFKNLVGKTLETPLFKKRVPVLADADVDPAFGTGIVMVCTFGDKQDVVWANRHKLPVIQAFGETGGLLNAGAYDGLSLKQAREKIVGDLEKQGLLERVEEIEQTVKIHDRCEHPAEFLLSTQWFIRLKGFEEEVKAASAGMKWTPDHARQLLVDWADALEWDWCFSRQRVFGVPIPFWYCGKCGEIVAPPATREALPVDPARDKPPRAKCACGGELVGEISICDGWVDSSITPLFIAGWPFDEKSFARLYPNALRPQGTDIIRTWAFYSIFRCLMLTGKPPFKEVLVNGMVCGSDGRKMSKSLGNYVEAKEVVAKSSADALRQWAALSGGTGKDNVFYWKDVLYAQSFLTKLWNAARFVEKIGGGDGGAPAKEVSEKELKALKLGLTDQWVLQRLSKTIESATRALNECDFYTALTTVQSFFWHEFCDYYLEDVKHKAYGAREDEKRAVAATTRFVLQETLKLLAPFVVYVTEEIYSNLFSASGGKESIHSAQWPKPFAKEDARVQEIVGAMHFVLGEVRKFKASKGLALNAPLESITIKTNEKAAKDFADVVEDLKAIAKISAVEVKVAPASEGIQVVFEAGDV